MLAEGMHAHRHVKNTHHDTATTNRDTMSHGRCASNVTSAIVASFLTAAICLQWSRVDCPHRSFANSAQPGHHETRMFEGVTTQLRSPTHIDGGASSHALLWSPSSAHATDTHARSSARSQRSTAPLPVKVMGLQRSGTNIWQLLLQRAQAVEVYDKACRSFASDGVPMPTVTHTGRRPVGGIVRNTSCWKHFRVHRLTTKPEKQYKTFVTNVTSTDVLDRMVGWAAQVPRLPVRAGTQRNGTVSKDTTTATSLATATSLHQRHQRNLTYLVSIKSPLAWVASECEWIAFCGAKDVCTHGEDPRRYDLARIDRLAREWSGYVRKWFDLQQTSAPGRVVIVPYEAVITNVSRTLREIDAQLGHVGLADTAHLLLESNTGEVQVRDSLAETLRAAQHKYLACTYLTDFYTPDVAKAVMKAVDKSTLKRLGMSFDKRQCVSVSPSVLSSL
eukprot:m.205044 g.205044  ORF g.205044 m.205044 type:complete len:447 (-) comp22758_c0_seq1:91-1431(-)